MTKETVAYMCTIDWDHEIGAARDCRLYESIEDLKRQHGCWAECGITKIKVTAEFLEHVVPQDFSRYDRPEQVNPAAGDMINNILEVIADVNEAIEAAKEVDDEE